MLLKPACKVAAERCWGLVQIRASPCTAPPGNTFWSAPVQLDALGAAAVVLVPAAMAARDATTTDADSAIVVSVTAVEVILIRCSVYAGLAHGCTQ